MKADVEVITILYLYVILFLGVAMDCVSLFLLWFPMFVLPHPAYAKTSVFHRAKVTIKTASERKPS